ncbi:Lethal (2) 35Be [Daphnia magna]|uniref:Lethal (2) 35Be n=1 Tax=Daphnia magna TaxID=35525 RepID=A0A0P5YVS8_9CRUS|nr:Lethal (2) 35Be [Daphnia magna]
MCSRSLTQFDSDNDDVEEERNPHETPEKEILWAAAEGDINVIRNLLQNNPALVHVKDHDGYSALHRACYENHVNIVELLLKNKSNIHALTNEMWQPLHSACKWNSSLCVTLLLERGASINAVTKGGLTPLHLASSNSTAYETLIVLLNHPLVNPRILSNNGETAWEISRRCGPYSRLFDMVNEAVNEI